MLCGPRARRARPEWSTMDAGPAPTRPRSQRMAMDCTYRLRIPQRSGQLAKVANRIAEHGGLIGDVTTIAVARNEALREITVELRDKEHAEALAAGLGALPGVSVVWFHDRAFIAHDGGKLEVKGRHKIRTNQDVRDVYTPGVARVCEAIAEFPV